MYGHVGPTGLFAGQQNAFIYPDMQTVLFGHFQDGQMVEATPKNITQAVLDQSGSILELTFQAQADLDKKSQIYKFWPSGLNFVAVPPLLEDPYEHKFVYAGPSKMSNHAGDGLFLKRDVPANTTIAFYNGIRVKPGDPAPYVSTGYQIFVDWNKKSVS